MMATELIKQVQSLIDKHGDLPVYRPYATEQYSDASMVDPFYSVYFCEHALNQHGDRIASGICIDDCP